MAGSANLQPASLAGRCGTAARICRARRAAGPAAGGKAVTWQALAAVLRMARALRRDDRSSPVAGSDAARPDKSLRLPSGPAGLGSSGRARRGAGRHGICAGGREPRRRAGIPAAARAARAGAHHRPLAQAASTTAGSPPRDATIPRADRIRRAAPTAHGTASRRAARIRLAPVRRPATARLRSAPMRPVRREQPTRPTAMPIRNRIAEKRSPLPATTGPATR